MTALYHAYAVRRDEVEELPVGNFKFGRSGTFWEVDFQKNSTVIVTNSSKSLKNSPFKIELGRIGNLAFTDDGGRTYGLAVSETRCSRLWGGLL